MIENKNSKTEYEDDDEVELEDWVKRKNFFKVVRTIFEIIVCILVVYGLLRAFVLYDKYEPYNENKVEMASSKEDPGFVAISYFGVSRDGSETLVSTDTLNRHLKALYDNGYVTISQQDIYDYYKYGKSLPKKSLFIMFEDGRRDTTIFAESVTNKYNFLSSILTYANKFEDKDETFLQPKDLRELSRSSFWEFGTNGYRLSYINVFDRYDRFLGQLTTKEYNDIHGYLGRKYDHYLMDFLRDKNDIPVESYREMSKRINGDYDMMEELYLKKVGELPRLYILMHSNTGMFGENDKVSAINEDRITSMFDMNFNRESFSVNTRDSSIYDLTRMQPQPYWKTNHLLMRIRDDNNLPMAFVTGDADRQSHWKLIKGAAEFDKNNIYVTCESKSNGIIELLDGRNFADIVLSVELLGNALGKQKIYIRSDDKLTGGVTVATENDKLMIYRSSKLIYERSIDDIIGTPKVSVEEDSKAALLQEKSTFLQYASTTEEMKILSEDVNNTMNINAKSVAAGAKEYKPDLELKTSADHKLIIKLKGEQVTVFIDDCLAFDEKVSMNASGRIFLESGWGGEAYSQRNLADDIYDGVFKDLLITTNTGAEEETVLYDNMLHDQEKVEDTTLSIWNRVINFFVDYF